MNGQDAVLGVDIGTSSSKAVLVGLDGRLLATAVRTHATATPAPGHFEQDAELVWWSDFVALCRELGERCPRARVVGVGASGLGPCVLPTDAADHPLRPAILYGIDTRAESQISAMNEALGAAAILERSGNRLTTQAVGPKLQWLHDRQPDVWARTRRVHTAASYLIARLTGEYVLDHASASQAVPLYDPRALTWNDDWWARIAPAVDRPRLVWPEDVAGVVTPGAAEVTGLPAGTPVAGGTIDAWAEGVSVGATGIGDVMIMYGTTMFLTVVTDRALTSDRLWSTVGALRDTHTLAAGMATSGAITDWFRRLTGADYPELTIAAAAVPAGSGGLLLLPYFAGERTPLFEPRARGVVAGLSLSSGRGEIYRAILEGTAFGVRHNLAAFAATGAELSRVVAVGGGTGNTLWPEIVSSVTGHPQFITRETVGAALGDAVLAANAIGAGADTAHWNPVVDSIEPRPEWKNTYDALWPDYLALHERTREIQQALSDLAR